MSPHTTFGRTLTAARAAGQIAGHDVPALWSGVITRTNMPDIGTHSSFPAAPFARQCSGRRHERGH